MTHMFTGNSPALGGQLGFLKALERIPAQDVFRHAGASRADAEGRSPVQNIPVQFCDVRRLPGNFRGQSPAVSVGCGSKLSPRSDYLVVLCGCQRTQIGPNLNLKTHPRVQDVSAAMCGGMQEFVWTLDKRHWVGPRSSSLL